MRYFQWTDGGYHKGCDLISNNQIGTLLRYHSRKEEAYATVQDYDSDGNILGCYLYFDIDNKNLEDAHSAMIDTVFQLEEIYDCKAAVYFSGSKGYHILLPLYIVHSRCHEIVKMIALDNKLEVDISIYKSKAWFRCANTWNSKGKRYKTLAGPNDSLRDLLHKSKIKRSDKPLGFNRVDLDISSYIKRLPDLNIMSAEYGSDFVKDMHPCMVKLWNMEEPPSGQAHWLLNIIARHCYRSDLSIDEAEAVFSFHHFWKNVNSRDYKKVIASIYRSGKASIGCKYGRDADLLQDYCTKLCKFNESTDIFKTFNKES